MPGNVAPSRLFTPDIDWVCLFAGVIHATMRQASRKLNTCVEAACVAVGAAASYGYPAEAVPVAVKVEAGGHATILPGPNRNSRPGFDGHLLVHFPGCGVADLTSDQFHDQGRGLHVPAPLVFPATREHLRAGIEVPLPGGTIIEYRELVGDLSWQRLPAWKDSSALAIALVMRNMATATGSIRSSV